MNLSWLKSYNLLIFDEIDSTSLEAVRLAKAGVAGNFLVWAKSQTNGKGKQGRPWESREGNLYISLLLDLNIPINLQPQLCFVTALAVYDSINSFGDLNVTLKWPNDVLINNKKISGILLESLTVHKKDYLIIGVGVNINNSPINVDRATTDLLKEGIDLKDSSELLDAFMTKFEKLLSEWQAHGFATTRERWLKCAHQLGKIATIDDGAQRISGIFNDIDLNGAIRLKLASGQICSMSIGEIFFNNS